MADYELIYWTIPFRGQFVRAVLAYAGKSWTEVDGAAVAALREGPPGAMPVPFMGPPILIDPSANLALSQMPAILLHLGDTLALMPPGAAGRAMTAKVVNDCNDVLGDFTWNGGRQMWTAAKWQAFQPRLRRWMTLWEELGRRHGLAPQSGFLLGGDAPGLADIATAVLWSTVAERFAPIAALLDEAAPMTAALSRRISALPPLAALAAKARQDYGDTYCGGQIEASLRKVLGA